MTVSNQFTIRIVSSSAPSWFTDLPYMEWVPIAAGATPVGTFVNPIQNWQKGATIKDEVPDPPYQGAQSPDDIIEAGNGAAVNQEDREMYLVANGGHSGYQGNESYRLILNPPDGIPKWQRITDPTPFADLDWHIDSDNITEPEQNQYWSRNQLVSPGNGVPPSGSRTWNTPTGGTVDIRDYPACAGDGAVSSGSTFRQQWAPWNISSLNDIDDRPRTMHTATTPWYANGKVWFPLQNSVDVGTGFSLNIILSFNVAQVLAGTIPRPFVPGRDVWDYWETVTEMGNTGNLFGTAALDRSTNKVWYHPGNEPRFYSVRTDSATGQRRTVYTDPNSSDSDFLLAGSAICPVAGRRLWMVLSTGTGAEGRIRVYDLDLIEQGQVNATSCQNLFVQSIFDKSWNFNHNQSGDYAKGWGVVWHEPDRSFLLYNCDDMNRGGARSRYLRRIKPPLLNDAYDRNGAWVCDEIAVGGELPDDVTSLGTASVSGGSFTRFNIIYDMGNGDSLLLQQGDYDTPCYVMRLSDTLIGV